MDARELSLLNEFEKIRPALVSWASFIDTQLTGVIKAQYQDSGFIQMGPAHRCKSDDSLLKKAFYREKDYTNPLLQIEDKVATRIVVVTSENVYKVKDIVVNRSEWNHKVTKDIREINESNPNLFDYQSVHIILWPKQAYEEIEAELLTCELQIRTLLQHSYAEVTHDSVYKGPYQNDNAIKRNLAKCMALMETTDDMFCNIFNRISMEGSEKSATKDYVFELIGTYNKFLHKNVTYQDIDSNFTDSVFRLLEKKPVPIEELDEYCSDNEDIIRIGVETGQSIIFNQPAVLVIFFYADLYRPFLESECKLSHATLKKIMAAINVATSY